ncbi:hypothetical protein PS1_019313 [Malus domestica]
MRCKITGARVPAIIYPFSADRIYFDLVTAMKDKLMECNCPFRPPSISARISCAEIVKQRCNFEFRRRPGGLATVSGGVCWQEVIW